MGVEPKIGVKTPNHPFVHRVFHDFHHPFWGFSPYFWVDTQLKPKLDMDFFPVLEASVPLQVDDL